MSGCTETTMENCLGLYQGDGTVCDEDACSVCCRCDGPPESCTQSCRDVALVDFETCTDGCPLELCTLAITDASSCDGDCPTTGCCEAEDICLESDAELCAFAGGNFFDGQVCDPGTGGCMPAPPTSTATPTPTATSTPTATATATETPTATATNPPAPDGAPCLDPNDCVSGNCVADLCCDQPCNGSTQRCDLPDSAGTCVDLPAPAPAASNLAGLIGLAILTAIAALALRRRRDLKHFLMSL